MIVLSVIGVLTAILLPVARNAMPDKDVMKFKKIHNAFQTGIRELVTSDKYYLDGDLGTKINGDLIDGTHERDNIDGMNKGEDPFGYGVRADGKILIGTRASEWITKSIQNKD